MQEKMQYIFSIAKSQNIAVCGCQIVQLCVRRPERQGVLLQKLYENMLFIILHIEKNVYICLNISVTLRLFFCFLCVYSVCAFLNPDV